MKHALRKYITPCGSALFMVVSTMAALIVLVTAMYMSVLSSRQVQYATFDQEQAYVTSTSIADAINAYLTGGNYTNSAFTASVSDLKVGESLTTDGNGFASLSSSGTNSDTPVGAYTVDIVRLPDEDRSGKTVFVYDVAVTVSVNDVIETTHTYITAETSTTGNNMDHVDRFFTATGYLPNDIWVGTVVSDSALYFDNEYAIVSEHINSNSHGGDGDCNLNMDITCAGSLLINQGQAKDFTEPRRWVVGNTLTIGSSFNSDITLGGTSTKHSTVYVGGDLVYNANWKHFGEFTDVYVIGNIYANTGGWFDGNVYVNGNVVISTNSDVKFKNLYINGSVIGENGVTPNMSNINVAGTWADTTACEDTLNARIGGQSYPNWVVDTSGMKTEDIVFNTDDTNLGANAKYIHYINKDCKIGKVYDAYKGSGTSVELTIIIDTGDDPDKGINLSVTANCDDQGIDNTFMWYPEARASGGKIINILTIGCGKLVVDVPEGVTYQASDREVFGHIGWFMTSGGTVETTTNGAPYFKRGAFDIYSVQNKIRDNKFIVSGGEDCEFERVEGTYLNCKEEVHYTCKEHGGMYEQKDYDKYVSGFTTSLCRGRLDKKVMKKFLEDNPSVLSNLEKYHKNYYGKNLNGSCSYSEECYYPNVNIFVVSCDVNADIQFGIKKANPEESLQANIFFGYVYAPYMTFVSIGDGGSMKSVGGLIVSDVQINGNVEFLFAQPEDSISHMAGSGSSLSAATKKTWRRYGV